MHRGGTQAGNAEPADINSFLANGSCPAGHDLMARKVPRDRFLITVPIDAKSSHIKIQSVRKCEHCILSSQATSFRLRVTLIFTMATPIDALHMRQIRYNSVCEGLINFSVSDGRIITLCSSCCRLPGRSIHSGAPRPAFRPVRCCYLNHVRSLNLM